MSGNSQTDTQSQSQQNRPIRPSLSLSRLVMIRELAELAESLILPPLVALMLKGWHRKGETHHKQDLKAFNRFRNTLNRQLSKRAGRRC